MQDFHLVHIFSLLVFNDRLREFLNSDAELCNDVQYALNSGKCFDDLSTFKKVCLINSLCDCRLLTTDAYEKTVVSLHHHSYTVPAIAWATQDHGSVYLL